jgi:hypothetical protein
VSDQKKPGDNGAAKDQPLDAQMHIEGGELAFEHTPKPNRPKRAKASKSLEPTSRTAPAASTEAPPADKKTAPAPKEAAITTLQALGIELGLKLSAIESRGEGGAEIVLVLDDGREVTLGEPLDVLDPRGVDRALIEQIGHVHETLYSAKEWRPLGARILALATESQVSPIGATFDEILLDFEQTRTYAALVSLKNSDTLREIFGAVDDEPVPERPAFPAFRDAEQRLFVHVPSLRDFARTTYGRVYSLQSLQKELRTRSFERPGCGDSGISTRTAQGIVKRRFAMSPEGWGLGA